MNTRYLAIAVLMLLAACASSSDRAKLTDPEVAMVVRVSNLGEVREGQLARDKATDAAVRDFAQMMVIEHTAASNQAESDLARADIPSADSSLSRQIDANSGSATDMLRASPAGPAFDRAYMDRQVDAHRYILGVIDQTLVPNARSKVLRRVLADMRKLIEQHLTRAQQIQSTLAK